MLVASFIVKGSFTLTLMVSEEEDGVFMLAVLQEHKNTNSDNTFI